MRGRAADLPGAAAGATQLREKEEPGWALRFSLCKVLRLLSGQPGWGWREGQELLRSGLAGWRAGGAALASGAVVGSLSVGTSSGLAPGTS